ncbi:hypothetical protein L496_3313 [Bordetella holmesii CDC-H572-BH]|nr:hypothetical protein L496_3313 [Bordetella holmesii CDC-H572-BH]
MRQMDILFLALEFLGGGRVSAWLTALRARNGSERVLEDNGTSLRCKSHDVLVAFLVPTPPIRNRPQG